MQVFTFTIGCAIFRPQSELLKLVVKIWDFTVGRSHVSPPEWSSTTVPFNHPGVYESIELPPELQEPWWPEKCPAGGSETTTRHHIQAQMPGEIQYPQAKNVISTFGNHISRTNCALAGPKLEPELKSSTKFSLYKNLLLIQRTLAGGFIPIFI